MPNIGIYNIITLTQNSSVHETTCIFTVWLEVVETLMEVTLANHSVLLLVLKQETVTRKNTHELVFEHIKEPTKIILTWN